MRKISRTWRPKKSETTAHAMLHASSFSRKKTNQTKKTKPTVMRSAMTTTRYVSPRSGGFASPGGAVPLRRAIISSIACRSSAGKRRDVDDVGRLEGPDERLDPGHGGEEAGPTHHVDGL